MEALSDVKRGTYKIKWMIGIPEVDDVLRSWKIKEGNFVDVMDSDRGTVVVGVGQRRFVIDKDVAQYIKV